MADAKAPTGAGHASAAYSLREVETLLGLGRGAVKGLIEAGFVSPARGERREYRFTFQDVVVLRTAFQLKAAQVPPRRLLTSLRRLRERLPEDLPLSGLRIKAIGGDVAVRSSDAQWEAASGQVLLDFEVSDGAGGLRLDVLATLPGRPPGPAPAERAAAAFVSGEALEASDPAAAEAAYRDALSAQPVHADALLNLGALLCDQGRCGEAVALYDEAVARLPEDPMLHFNRAIALEDHGRLEDAAASYEEAIGLMPGLADAHYNAARLHERLGHAQAALRHYSAYRRLES